MSSPSPSAGLLLDALVTRSLDSTVLHYIATDLAASALTRLGAATPEEAKKQWCCTQLKSILEHFGNSRQVLGLIADLPLSERVEKWALRKVVEHAFLKLQQDEPAPCPLALAPVPPSLTGTPALSDTGSATSAAHDT
jgi:hypothetical protein